MKKFLKPVIVFCVVIALCLYTLINGCSIVTKNDMKNTLRAYTSENSLYRYYTFKAVIVEVLDSGLPDETIKLFKFDVDYEYFEQNYGDDPDTYVDGTKRWESAVEEFNKYYFGFVDSNFRIIQENGGYIKMVEGAEVIICANDYFGWNGWSYPILSLQIGDTVYLDFETGLENYLNYVRAGFKDPG